MKNNDNHTANQSDNQIANCTMPTVEFTSKTRKNSGHALIFNGANCQVKEYKILLAEFIIALILTSTNVDIRLIILLWGIFISCFIKFDVFNIFIRMSPKTKLFLSVSIMAISSSIALHNYLTNRVAIILIVLSIVAILISYRLNQAWIIEAEYQQENEDIKLIKRQKRKIESLEKELQKVNLSYNMQQNRMENLKIEIESIQDVNKKLTETNNELLLSLDEEERKSQAFENHAKKLSKQLEKESELNMQPMKEIEEISKINERDMKVLELLESGLSLRKVGSIVGISGTMVSKIRDKHKESA